MPERVTDMRVLDEAVRELLRAGAETNGLPPREELEHRAAAGGLFLERTPDALVLLRRCGDFERINYLLRRGADLPPLRLAGTAVLELPFRAADPAQGARERRWEALGFAPALDRVRLTRPAGDAPAGEDPAVRAAVPAEADELFALLSRCFFAPTACLPSREEFSRALAEGRVLRCGQGVLHFRPAPGGTELRHLAVAPEEQGRGAARRLVEGYLRRCGARPCRVWTAPESAAARLYASRGFAADAWRSRVMLKREEEHP